ncbi:MAG: c-type cytochrome biogenesis protein CcmI [Albidovulum sp.]|nr:c-type cytochrome biogenesis protein CcmI [Albidovulum sp.]
MIFWLTALFISILSAAVIAYALLKASKGSHKSAEVDIAFYKQQLRELDREIGRGIVSPDDAEASKLEISRRILEADKIARGELPPKAAPAYATAACIAAVFALLVPGGLYLYGKLGRPGMSDLPHAQRIENAKKFRLDRPTQENFVASLSPRLQDESKFDPQYLALVERLREAVATRPGDLEGLRLLATHESFLGNFTAATEAMEQVLSLRGDRAGCDEHGDLAEYMIQSAEGYVSPEAESALETCLSMDAFDPRARYYMGLMHAQTGRPDIAFEVWRELLERGPLDSYWQQAIESQIAHIAELAGIQFQLPQRRLPGPSADDIAAASEMDPSDRAAMIEGMVSSLESRLAEEGGSVDEWIRLIRSLGVLGQIERAAAARKAANEAFFGNEEELESIARAAREFGLP